MKIFLKVNILNRQFKYFSGFYNNSYVKLMRGIYARQKKPGNNAGR
jgi:hypothetical protein